MTKNCLNKMLYAMLGNNDLVFRWWDSPNRNWNLSTPNQIWNESDEGKREVIQYILGHLQK